VPLFTSNDTAFDVEVSLALPTTGGNDTITEDKKDKNDISSVSFQRPEKRFSEFARRNVSPPKFGCQDTLLN
jgi:hypothetical protein